MAFFNKNKKSGKLPDFYESLPTEGENNLWYRLTDGETVIIFVHGIFSDSRGCWLYDKGKDLSENQYWPNLLSLDPDFDGISIFLGGYYTAWDSQGYDASQASKELFYAIKRPILGRNWSAKSAPIEKSTLIFVCHSTGGIVVRHLLYHNSNFFKNKTVGLVLIASPSYGSKVADKFDLLAKYYNNELGKQLQWKNPFLKELDNNFKDFVHDKEIPNLMGVEAVENHFIIHSKWIPFWTKTLLVNEDSAGKYFKSVKVLANTDHFSAVKPHDKTHPAYLFLLDFKNALLEGAKIDKKGSHVGK